MTLRLVVLALCLMAAPIRAAEFDAKSRVADLDWFAEQLAAQYAYLPEGLDLERLRTLYRPQAEAATTPDAWLHVVEQFVGELHDHHATLGRNARSSPRLIPSGTDLWAQMQNRRAVLTQVRAGSAASKAGIQSGDIVVAVNGVPIARAIAAALPRTLKAPNADATDFTLRTLLAGSQAAERRMTVEDSAGRQRDVVLPPYNAASASTPVSWRNLDGNKGYIRIENSLGDTAAIAAFDEALAALSGVTGLVLDLRNTPSGGNTDVAEPMLGRFVATASGYQRVFEPAPGKSFPADSWVKQVQPRGTLVTAKLVVLVDHWTGSMGEGMAIGLDALKRARVVGTPMAGLRGGTNRFVLPNTGIPIYLPIERLYHVDGTPRENFIPPILVDPTRETGDDPILARGLSELDRIP